MSDTRRPEPAAGHLFLLARGVAAAAKRLVEVGVRPLVLKESFAVMELRGGTHIVVRELQDDGPHEAPFDLMYDDIDAARQRFADAGFSVTEVHDGRIHRSFTATAPESYTIQVNDSHAGNRPV